MLGDAICVGSCDSNFKNYKLLFKAHTHNMFSDLEVNPQTGKLMILTTPKALLQVDINRGLLETNTLNCENIIVDDIDYCPADEQYYLCIRHAVWENDEFTIKHYICRSKLTDKRVEILREIK